MKKSVIICAVMMLLTSVAYVNATPVPLTDAILIEKASEPDTYLLTLLYNEYGQWQYYDIGISAEPIEGVQDFQVGEILSTAGYLNTWAWDEPWNGLQFRASSTTGVTEYLTNIPLFSFKYTGSADNFIIYDMSVSESVPVGYIPVPIPEPVTMALLGLGGLFLSKRKK